jgi:hypothetical protein
MSETLKLCPISHCGACPRARFMRNVGHVVSDDDSFEPNGDRSRIYVGCGAVDPPRPFDYGSGVFSPQGIPEWCPLPDAPKEMT